MKFVLMPCPIEKSVGKAIANTFDENVTVIRLSDMVVTNYADDTMVQSLYDEMEDAFYKWMQMLSSDDEVYLMLAGGSLQIAIAMEILKRHKIPVKYLVYEKKVKKYVVMEIDHGVQICNEEE